MRFDLNCPYCNAEVEPNEDQRSPDINIECECQKCEKTFLYSIEYEPTYTAWKAPCLNDGPHEYKQIIGAPKEYFAGRHRCKHCDHEIKVEDFAAIQESAPVGKEASK